MSQEADADEVRVLRVAQAIMEARIEWGWRFGKRRRVMAIDLLMAEAAIRALKAGEEARDV